MGQRDLEDFRKVHGDLLQGQLDWCRRLSDGEILAIQRDAPNHLFYIFSAWFRYHAPVDKGYAAVQQSANRFVEDMKLDLTTQTLFWGGVERMGTIQQAKPYDASQLPLI